MWKRTTEIIYKASLLCSTFISGPDHIWRQEARKVGQHREDKNSDHSSIEIEL